MNITTERFFRRHKVQQAARLVKAAKRPLILTGAGVSVASGVPPFRGEGGIWHSSDYAKYAFPETLVSDPDGSWRLYEEARRLVESCPRNAGHKAIDTLVRRGASLFTQNVDGLHGREAIELHGSLRRHRCGAGCGFVREPLAGTTVRADVAVCPACGSRLRHDVVLFGEALPQVASFNRALAACDLVLFAGTSGLVTPIADIAQAMHGRGVPVIDVNTDPLNVSRLTVDVYVCAKAESALPLIVDGV